MAAVVRLVGCAGTQVDISSKTVSSSDDSLRITVEESEARRGG